MKSRESSYFYLPNLVKVKQNEFIILIIYINKLANLPRYKCQHFRREINEEQYKWGEYLQITYNFKIQLKDKIK